ncbi:CARDB domain-containing protein [Marinicella meishanensis]|uniref:CARDB domain-containing protein n=1 Tax=Marinicella meishanensis TaxID=2873263 RepID=UPI001CBD4097|nr:CARDB domain-containing protein [Marinicella sp. NBU2979]
MSSEQLQATIDMGSIGQWEMNPGNRFYDTTLDVLVHEMMHRWGIYVLYEDADNNISQALLGRDGVHWNFFMHSQASLMYGSSWNENTPGEFEAIAVSRSLSPLDLYLMGFKHANEVPDFFLIEDGTPGNQTDTPPLIGTQASGSRVNISINDIIAVEGIRSPGVDQSQKQFSFKFVLLKKPEESIDDAIKGNLLVLQKELQKRFFAETSGMGEIRFPAMNQAISSGDPVILDYPLDTNAVYDPESAELFLTDTLAQYENWSDKSATQVRDTATALVTFKMLSLSDWVTVGENWLANFSSPTHDEMAWMLLSGGLSSTAQADLAQQLKDSVNDDGGWGLKPGGGSSSFDTALVLKALMFVEGENFIPTMDTLTYVLDQINEDGGFGYAKGGASALTSSSMMLHSIYHLTNNSVAEQQLIDFILAQQHPDGGFGFGASTAHETALVIEALEAAHNQDHSSVIEDAVTLLSSMQSVNGSFEGSIYATSLAMNVLADVQSQNISLSQAAVSNGQPIAGENIAIDFTVLNTSDQSFDDVSVAIMIAEQIISSDLIAELPARQSISERIVLSTTGMEGIIDLQLIIDLENNIDESNELDNKWPLSIQVQPVTSAHELAFDWSSLTYDPSTVAVLPNDLSTSVIVNNLSSSSVDDVEVSLARFIDDFNQEILDTLVISLDSMSSQTVSFDTAISQVSDTLNYVLLIDPNNQIQEVNEENNQIQFSLTVEANMDLTVNPTSVSHPEPFVLGQSDLVTFAVSNPGTQSSPGFDVKVYFLGTGSPELLYENFIPELNGGQSLVREFSWTPDEIGDHQINFIIDEDDLVAESDEGNNQLSLPVSISNNIQTNLLLGNESLSFNPDPGLSGQDLVLTATIQNTSNNDSGSFDVNFYQQLNNAPNQLIDTVTYPGPLNAQDQVDISTIISSFQSFGEITFVAEVDPTNAVDEFNENDNVAFKTFRVLSKADGMVSAGGIDLNPSQPVLGEPITVEVSVANLGEQDLIDGELRLYTASAVSRTLVGQLTIPSIQAGSTLTTDFNFTFPNDDTIENVEAEFDSNDEIDEINESNNHAILLIENQNRELYVSEQFISPNGDGVQDHTNVVFNLTASDDISIKIINEYGELVKSFPALTQVSFGDVSWDGKNVAGRLVTDGHYWVQLFGLNSGIFKETRMVVDTNRSPLLDAINENKGTFFDLTCSLNAVSGQVFFSANNKYIFTNRYVDNQGYEQSGLFRIKTDATEVKSLLSNAFLTAHRFNHNQPFKVLEDGNIIFYTQNDTTGNSELWKYNTASRHVSSLNGPSSNTFSLDYIGDSFTLVRYFDQGQYHHHKVSHDPAVSSEALNFAVNGEQVVSKKKLKYGWVWATEDSNQVKKYYHDSTENLSNPMQLAEYPELADYIVSENGKFFFIHSKDAGELKYYRADNNQVTLLIDEADDPMTISVIRLLRENQLLKVSAGFSRVYDSFGQLLVQASHPINMTYFENQLTQEFGSLDSLILYHETGEIPYALSDLQDLSLVIEQLQVSEAADQELYLQLSATLSGTLDLSSIGYSDELVQIYANDQFNQRVQYSDLTRIEVTELNHMKVYNPPLFEGMSRLFSVGSKMYPKSILQDIEKLESQLLSSFQFEALSVTQQWPQVVQKAFLHSHYLPFHTQCAQFENEFYGIFQSEENLTAFISTEVQDGGVLISGSAFDGNFDRFTLEWQSIGSANQSWQIIDVIDTPLFEGFMTYWTPTVAGHYRLKLTAFDQAGNQTTDTSEVYVGEVSSDINNPNVSPMHFSPNGDGVQDQVLIEYDVMQTSELLIEIKDSNGVPVKTITREYIGPQSDVVSWDGSGHLGQALTEGVYTISFNNYSYQVTLDVTPPVTQARLMQNQKGMDYSQYLTFPWSTGVSTHAFYYDEFTDEDNLKANSFIQSFDEISQSWSDDISRRCFLKFTHDFIFDLHLNELYRCYTSDLAGNQSIFAEMTIDIDPIYSVFLLKRPPWQDYPLSVVPFSCPEDDGTTFAYPPCEDDFVVAKENSFGIADWDVEGDLFFVLESFSNESINQVKMVTSYREKPSDPGIVEEHLLQFAAKEFLQTELLLDEEELQMMDGGAPGMFGLQHGRKTYYLHLASDLFPNTAEVINVRFDFSYANGDTHSVDWNIQFANQGVELLASVDQYLEKGLGFLPPELRQATKFNQRLTTSLEAMREAFDISSDKDYWLFVKTQADEIVNPILTATNIGQDPVLYLPVYAATQAADEGSAGWVIQLFEIDHNSCYFPSVKYHGNRGDGTSINIDDGLGAFRPICMSDMVVTQKYIAGESCDASHPMDSNITIEVDGMLGASSNLPATLEIYRLQGEVEDLLYITTDIALTQDSGRSMFLTEVVFDKSNFAAGTQDIYARFKDSEGNAYEERIEILIQDQSVNTQIIEPNGGQVFCATDLNTGIIQLPVSLQFDNNSNKNMTANQFIEGSWIKSLTGIEIHHGELNLVSDLVYDGYLVAESWELAAPEFAGESQIIIETINSTGVSQCTSIEVQIDALLDADISSSQNTQFLSPLGTGFNTEVGYLSIYAREPLQVQVELYQLDGQGVANYVGLQVDDSLMIDAQTDLFWDGYYAGALQEDGTYLLESSITDDCGLEQQFSTYVVIDSALPVVGFDQPVNGAVVGSLENVLAVISDPHLNPGLAHLSFEYNGSWNPIDVIDLVALNETDFEVFSQWNLSQLPADTYPLRISATDLAGNQNEAIIEVSFNDTSDLLWDYRVTNRYVSPNDDQVLDLTSVLVGLNLNAEVSIEVFNSSLTSIRTLVNSEVLGQGSHELEWDGKDDFGVVAPDGDYEIRLTATESGAPGNMVDMSINVVVDTTAPVGLLAPNLPVIQGTGELVLELNEINPQLTQVWIQEIEPPGPESLLLQTATDGQFTLVDLSGLSESEHQVRLLARDKAGNQLSQVHSFTVDNIPPVTVLSEPTDQSFQGGESATIEISGEVTEAHFESYQIELSPAVEPAQWSPIANGAELIDDNFTVTWPISMPDGNYWLKVVATDEAGLIGETVVEITIDTTPPDVALAAPAAQSTHATEVLITGSVTDDHLSFYSLSYKSSDQDDADWVLFYTQFEPVSGADILQWHHQLNSGSYDLRLQAFDQVGLVSEVVRPFIIDVDPPAPALFLEAELSGPNVLLNWQASTSSETVGYWLYRNNQVVNQNLLKETTYQDPAVAEGQYSYWVVAADAAGNLSIPSNTVDIAVDRSGPEVFITAPTQGQRISGMLAIHGTAFSEADFGQYRLYHRLSVAAPPGTLITQSNFPVTGAQLAELDSNSLQQDSEYVIRLEAQDLTGNSNFTEHTIWVDNVAPSAPLNLTHLLFNDNEVQLNWNANAESDLMGYLVFRNNTLISGDGTIQGSLIMATSWVDVDVPDGQHSYHVVAVDLANNFSQNSNQVEVDIDIQPPHVTITQPLNGAQFETAIAIHASSADLDIDQVLFEYSLDGLSWNSIDIDLTAPFSVTFDPSIFGLSFGTVQFKATATDEAAQIDPAPDVVVTEYTDLTPPEPVSGLNAIVTGRDIHLNWNVAAETDLSGYVVARKRLQPNPENDFSSLTSSSYDQTTYEDLGLPDGIYVYRLHAVDQNDNPSNPVNSSELRVYSVLIDQPYSPILDPANVIFNGSTPGSGVIDATLNNMSGSTPLASPTVTADGFFSIIDAVLTEGQNEMTVSQVDATGNRSVTALVGVQVSPIPPLPLNVSNVLNGYDLTLSWQAPEADTFGYLPYINQQPAIDLMPLSVGLNTSVSSSAYAAYTITDGDLLSSWAPSYADRTDGVPVFVQIEWPADFWVTDVQIHWEQDYDYVGDVSAPSHYWLQFRSPVGWITQADFSGNDNAQVGFTPDTPYLTDALRIWMPLGDSGGPRIALSEVEIWHQPLIKTTSYDRTMADGMYQIQLSAINQYGFESDPTPIDEITVGDVTPPDAVTLEGLLVNGNQVDLSWTPAAANDIAFYRLYRNGDLVFVSPDASTLQHTAVDLLNGEHRFQVVAVDGAGNVSDPSNEVIIVVSQQLLPPPQGLVISAPPGGQQLSLTWQAIVDTQFSHYIIYRSESLTEGFAPIHQLTESSHDDTGLTNGIRYHYRLTAVDLTGNESLPSAVVSAMPLDLIPPNPPEITAPTTHGNPISVNQLTIDVSGQADPGVQVALHQNDVEIERVQASIGYSESRVPFNGNFDTPVFNPYSDQFIYYDFNTGEVKIADPASNSSVALQSFDVRDYFWSSDGTLVYAVVGYGDQSSLRVFALNGSELSTVFSGYQINKAIVSMDGSQIFYWGEGLNPDTSLVENGLWLYTTSNDQFHKVNTNQNEELYQPAMNWYATDSLAFVNFPNGIFSDGELWLLNTQSQNLTSMGPTAYLTTLRANFDASHLFYETELNGHKAITRLNLSDQTTVTQARENTDLQNPLVGTDVNLVMVDVDCCDKTIIDMNSGENVWVINDTGFASQGTWLPDNRIVLLSNNELIQLQPPGLFVFRDLSLVPGSNELIAVAHKANGMESVPSAAIEVTLNEAVLADLEIKGHYLQLLPSQAQLGQSISGTVSVKNVSQVDVEQARLLIELTGPDLISQVLAPAPLDFSLSAGELLVESFTIEPPNTLGEYTVRVVADSNNQVLETNENNNSAVQVFQVIDDAIPDVHVTLNTATVLPGDDLDGMVRVYNPGLVFNGSIGIRITDANGFPVGFDETQAIDSLPSNQAWQQAFSWNSAAVFAGDYWVEVTLLDHNQQVLDQTQQAFAVFELAQMSLSLSTSAAQVQLNEPINLAANVIYQQGNVPQSGQLLWDIFDENEVLVFSDTQNLGSLLPGFAGSFIQSWTAIQPGAYVARVQLQTNLVTESAQIPFIVLPVTADLSLGGEIQDLPAAVILGRQWQVNYQLTNTHSVALENVPISLSLWQDDLSEQLLVDTWVTSLGVGASTQQSVLWDSSEMTTAPYLLVLSADLSGFGGSDSYLIDTLTIQTADIDGPQINIIEPQAMAHYPSSFEMRAVIIDEHANIGHVRVMLDGIQQVTLAGQGLNDNYQYWLTGVSDGSHEVSLEATDDWGNIGSQSVSIQVDSTAPVIDITGVSDGGLYNSPVQADVVITELNLANTLTTLNGAPYISGSPINEEGSHILMVVATDLAGNTSTRRMTFSLDLTAPVVIITHPANNSETNQPSISVSGNTEAMATVNLVNGAYQASVQANHAGLFNLADVPLASGSNSIIVGATDLAGNTGIDTTVNVMLIDGVDVTGSLDAGSSHNLGDTMLVDWQLTNQNNFPVTQLPLSIGLYRVADNQLQDADNLTANLTAAGVLTGTTEFATDTLISGPHRLEMQVQIEGQWQLLDDHLIDLQDVLGPELTVVEPISNQLFDNNVEFVVLANDAHSDVNEVSYQLDGSSTWVPLTWNGVEYGTQLSLTHGDHQVVFRAEDSHANVTTSAVVSFAVDTQGPMIEVNSPSDGLITNQPVLVDFEVTDDHGFVAVAELNQITIDNGHVVDAEGSHELLIIATDEVGNSASVIREFIIDTTAPVLVVTAPINNSQNTTGHVVVSGSSEPSNTIGIDVNGSFSVVKTDAAGQFNSPELDLQVGMNLITVTATDQAGNVSEPQIRQVEYIEVGALSGRVWQDDDQDGMIDGGEVGFNQVALRVTDENQISQEILTDTMGHYSLVDLVPGEYTVAVIEEALLNEWMLTTNNNPSQVIVEANLTRIENFGFYQEKPVLAANVRANKQTGRLLLLVDPATAQVDSNQCQGLSDYRLQRRTEHSWAFADVITAQLFDAQGTLIQTETAAYVDFINIGQQVIDQQGETSDVNLLLMPPTNGVVAAWVHHASGANPAIMMQPYQLTLSLQSSQGVTSWSSGLIDVGCELMADIGGQVGDLQVADVRLFPALATDDPNGPATAPYLASQQVMLENMLLSEGWSFDLVTEASEFSEAMATGQYVAYALLAENVLLSDTQQDQLMQAVNAGAGLLVASGHDNLTAQSYSAMGVSVIGTHQSAIATEWLASPFSAPEVLAIEPTEPVLQVSLSGATGAAHFNGPGINQPNHWAISWLDGLEGSAVFAGLDWLLQAMGQNGINGYMPILKAAFSYTHPLGLSNELGYARAVQFELVNSGRAVAGHVQVLLPETLLLAHSDTMITPNPDGFSFAYDLAEGETITREFWLMVNDSPATLTLEVYIDDDVDVHQSLDLTLIAGERPDLSAAITNCQAGVKNGQSLTYHYIIQNTGNKAINGVAAYAEFDAGLATPGWTCVASSGSHCYQNSGVGNLTGQLLDMPIGGQVEFIFQTVVVAAEPALVMGSAEVLMPDEISDVNPSDNFAHDSDTVYPFIFKDPFECAAPGFMNADNAGLFTDMEGH